MRNHEKKQSNKSNQLQIEINLLKKRKNDLSTELGNLFDNLSQVENTIGNDN